MRPIWAASRFTRHRPLQWRRLSLGRGATSEATSAAVGGGVEWAFWQNWSAKVEYDFYDFRRRDVTFAGTIFGVPEVVPGINVKQTISTVKFGVNYRFGPIPGAY